MSQPNPLRAIIQRLVSTPVEDLPGVAYFLASSISRCLAAPQASAVDKSTLLHKLKARISSLLQDRTPEGRFAAVVVAKAVLEAGGREILVDSEPWIRGLIGILNKSDPAATKKLAILAVSRAFLLMQEYPSLIREITTPLLPSFNTACLAAIRPKTTKTEKGTQIILSPLLATAMQSWIELLPRHPVTFRPFVTRFRPICLSLLSDPASPASITEHAGVLLMALHHSASKNSAVLEWAQLIQDTVLAAHATATRILRSVREEWVPARSDIGQDPDSSHSEGGEPGGGPDALGLAEWKGVHDGTQRLLRLLSLLKTSLSVVTAAEVPVPLGDVMDLCTRLLSTTIPGVGKNSPYTLKTNSEFGKDERDTLWSVLPSVHVSCLKLLSRLVAALEHSIVSISKPILEHMTWVFGAEKYLPQIRETSYTLLALLLPTMGGFEAETDVQHVSDIIRYACQDVLHSEKPFEIPVGSATAARPTTLNVDSFVSPTKTVIEQTLLENQSTKLAAAELISRFLQYVPADLIPGALRTEVDRTAVLAQKPQALLASVLNPATVRPGQRVSASLMPFLAQSSAALEVEALLRPRMPVIIDKHSDGLSTGMAMAESDFEARVLAEAQPASTSLLDRLDEALTVPVRAVPVGDSDLEQREAAMPVTERILTTGNGTAPPAGKRDFHTMNGHGFSGGDMFDASKVLSADIKSKKIRMDHDSMAVSVWGDENLRNGKSSVDEQVETDASFRKPVSQVQETYVENGIDMQVGAQSDAKGVFNGKGPAHNADDSDSDIPEINIEPDTDEEDDDDMYD